MRATARAVGRASLAKPWLLTPPLLLPWASRFVAASAGSETAWSTVGNAVLAAALLALAAALFAELWLGDGESLNGPRTKAAFLIYFVPLAALGVAGPLAWRTIVLDAADPEAARAAFGFFGACTRLAGGAALIASSLALWKWRPGFGPLQCLRMGLRFAAGNAGFNIALLFWTSAFGYAAVIALAIVRAFLESGPSVLFHSAAFLSDALLGAIMLAGFVAVPLQAAASGRLVER